MPKQWHNWAVRNRHNRLLSGLLVLSDMVGMGIAALAAYLLREELRVFRHSEDIAENVLPVSVLLIGIWLAALFLGGAYRANRTGVGTSEYTSVLTFSLVAAGTIAMFLYLNSYDLSRGFFLLLFLMGIPLLLVGRFLIRRLVHTLRARGVFQTRLLIAGSCDHVEGVARILRREKWLGYNIVGALPSDGDGEKHTASGIPVVGTPGSTLAAVKRTQANAVLFGEGAFDSPQQFNLMARHLEDHKVQMVVVPGITDISSERIDIRPVAGMPLVFIDRPRAVQAGSWMKRLFDLVGSSLLILVASPVMLVVALLIKVEDGGPVLFRQRRTGLKGEEFDCLKFRSMVVDAEARLRELEKQNEGAGVLFKMKDDPRVTRVGKVIRRYSIDELPQFFNVWIGQMSLVGPRPALPREVARYEEHVRRRLDVRPGITGLWQVSGRSDLSWEETVRLDLYYVDNWSILQDINILFRTFGAVLRSSGAY